VVVFVVGYVLSPVRIWSLVSGDGFGDGQVGHEVVGGGGRLCPGQQGTSRSWPVL